MARGGVLVGAPDSARDSTRVADRRRNAWPATDQHFHRIVEHGSTFPLEWLRLTVDPRANAPQSADAFGPFSWTRIMP